MLGDKTLRNLICCVLLAIGLSACSAVGVVESSDPKVKLGQAEELLYQQNRPGPAERLIREALEIYEHRKDEAGIAEAYRDYGFFFISPAVQKYAEIFAAAGFLDGTSYADRFRTSARYFERSAAHFTKIGQFDSVTSVQFNGARSHAFGGEREKACAVFDLSVESYRKNIAANPGAKVTLPKGYSDYEVLVRDEKARIGCV